MFDRRTFLVGAGSSLTLSLVKKFRWFAEEYDKPVIEAPPKVEGTLYWDFGSEGNALRLDEESKYDLEPQPTLGEYLELVYGKQEGDDLLDLVESYAYKAVLDPDDPEQLAVELAKPVEFEFWDSYWHRNESPEAKAYERLEGLDIGPILTGGDGQVGEVEFVECGFFSNNKYVAVPDPLSVSLLQHRLTELGTNLLVVADY